MKKKDIPQDPGALSKLTRELCYATDENGQYTTALSTGWDVKKTALDATWKNIEERIATVRKKVEDGEASPILFFMEYRLMDLTILSSYTGLWKWRIKRHMHPQNFKSLNERILERYAKAFNVSVSQLKEMKTDEN